MLGGCTSCAATSARPACRVTKALAASDDIMHTFRPWLMTMLAEIELAEGNLDAARRAADAAGTLAAVTSIPYQQALALRATGLIDAAAGDTRGSHPSNRGPIRCPAHHR